MSVSWLFPVMGHSSQPWDDSRGTEWLPEGSTSVAYWPVPNPLANVSTGKRIQMYP